MAKILIVDDDVQAAGRLAKDLSDVGHACAVRQSGRAGLDFANKEDLDLLVLDVMLPDISGFEVCRQIRSDSDLFTLPILILSAMDNPEEVQHGLEQGADDYVTKPIEARQLVQRIETLLRSISDEEYVDHLTELPDAEGTRKRIQQFITRHHRFALAYVEVLNLRNFAPSLGENAKQKALRHVSRAHLYCGDNFREDEFFVGHLGGGFFIAAVPAAEAESYCKKVQRSWRSHLEKLYDSLGLLPQLEASQQGDAGAPIPLDLIFCVTASEGDPGTTVQHLMDTLSRIRRTIGEVSVGGIHMDRRLT